LKENVDCADHRQKVSFQRLGYWLGFFSKLGGFPRRGSQGLLELLGQGTKPKALGLFGFQTLAGFNLLLGPPGLDWAIRRVIFGEGIYLLRI